ncbi:unnamed protein product [Moneuplotes crassus]|uniref:Sas10 C-terminal domain-containing protein n=2 Tax=Euplotes crassus TaxID=5936 RepID=A0AAD1U6Z6_EUPCR|nr:unnamed protein product [Moneuplotes crassus]
MSDSDQSIEDYDNSSQEDLAIQEDNVSQNSDSSDDIEANLQQQEDKAEVEQTWGKNKVAFYGRDKEADDISSEDDQDEVLEATRLQSIRAKKLQKAYDIGIKDSESDSDIQSDHEQEQDNDSDSEDGLIGDKMFATKASNAGDVLNTKLNDIKDLINDMKEVMAFGYNAGEYGIEYPDDEEITQQGLISFTKQLTCFIKKYACKADKTLIKRNKKVIDFLKVKEEIILNYMMFLNYYILGQAKLLIEPDSGINLQENQVLKKLSYYRTLINQIKPIDEQIMTQLQKVQPEREEELEAEGEDYEIDLDKGFEEESAGEGEFDNESDDEKISTPPIQNNLEEESEAEDLEIQKKPWNQNLVAPKKEVTNNFDEIEEMLEFGEEDNMQEVSDQEIDREEIKEVNKIVSKVVKKQKKVNSKNKLTSNVDDLVSEEDEPAKKRKKKELLKKQKAAKASKQDEFIEEANDQFGGFEPQSEEDTKINERQEKIDEEKQKLKEEKELKRKKKKERIEAQLEKQNEAINNNMSRNIMKGKGIYRKRPKKYRNPRIKHKLKYQQALTKRRRLVQEAKQGPQPKYSGELTGIRSNLIRSEKY